MEALERCSELIKQIALALDDTAQVFLQHSEDECNQALYEFYKRVRAIIYPNEKVEK